MKEQPNNKSQTADNGRAEEMKALWTLMTALCCCIYQLEHCLPSHFLLCKMINPCDAKQF